MLQPIFDAGVQSAFAQTAAKPDDLKGMSTKLARPIPAIQMAVVVLAPARCAHFSATTVHQVHANTEVVEARPTHGARHEGEKWFWRELEQEMGVRLLWCSGSTRGLGLMLRRLGLMLRRLGTLCRCRDPECFGHQLQLAAAVFVRALPMFPLAFSAAVIRVQACHRARPL